MVANELMDLVNEFNVISHVGMDDFSDKLTFLYTLVVHLVCIMIVTTKNYVSSPISCYISTPLSGERFDKFLTNYCWVHGTIPIHANATMPQAEAWDRLDDTHRIVYYQWVPFVLGIQALLAYIPRVIWQGICQNVSGVDLENLLNIANKAVHSTPKDRKSNVAQISLAMSELLAEQRTPSTSFLARLWQKLPCGQQAEEEGGRLSFGLRYIYLLVKMLYVLNALGQLFLIQWFLGFKDFAFGIFVLKDLLAGQDWRYTMYFPRVTYCNTRGVRHLGSQTRTIAQCALPINMLNEKVFLFLWFWYVMLLVATIFSFVLWLVRILYTSSEVAFVRKYLRFMANIPKQDFVMWRLFTRKYLRGDGVFLVRMIKTNSGDLLAKEVVEDLWKTYRKDFLRHDFDLYKEKHHEPAAIPLHPVEKNTPELLEKSEVPISRRPTLLMPERNPLNDAALYKTP